MDTKLSKLQEVVEDRGAWGAAVPEGFEVDHRVTERCVIILGLPVFFFCLEHLRKQPCRTNGENLSQMSGH